MIRSSYRRIAASSSDRRLRFSRGLPPANLPNGFLRNIEGGLEAVVDDLGLSRDWYPEANLSTRFDKGKVLNLTFAHKQLGIFLMCTETHLTGINLTLPMLWSGSADNSYLFKSDDDLNAVRDAVYALLDEISQSRPIEWIR